MDYAGAEEFISLKSLYLVRKGESKSSLAIVKRNMHPTGQWGSAHNDQQKGFKRMARSLHAFSHALQIRWRWMSVRLGVSMPVTQKVESVIEAIVDLYLLSRAIGNIQIPGPLIYCPRACRFSDSDHPFFEGSEQLSARFGATFVGLLKPGEMLGDRIRQDDRLAG
jgi:hypothetical protein